MPMSRPMKASYDRMMKKYANYPGLDGFIYTVRIIHDEGSEYLLQNAFYDNWSEEDYLWVLTEHQGEFIFAKDELVFYAQYKKNSGADIIGKE